MARTVGAVKAKGKSVVAILGVIAFLFLSSIVLAILLLMVLSNAPSLPVGDIALIVAMLDPAVAAVGLCLVVIQLHQDGEGGEHGRLVEQQRFLLEYNKVFIENERMMQVESDLERFDRGEIDETELITKDNRQSFVNYLVYLEGLAPLILDGVIELKMIDNLMAYRFFLAVNNPVMQREELFAFPGYYLGIFRLYRKWTDYRKARGLEIMREETSALEDWVGYNEWLLKAEQANEYAD